MSLKYHKHILPLLIAAKDIAVETGEEPKLSLCSIFETIENIQYLEHAAARIGSSYQIMKRELERKLENAENRLKSLQPKGSELRNIEGRERLIEALRHADEAIRLGAERERKLNARVDELVDIAGELEAAAEDDKAQIAMLETALTHETTRLKACKEAASENAIRALEIN